MTKHTRLIAGDHLAPFFLSPYLGGLLAPMRACGFCFSIRSSPRHSAFPSFVCYIDTPARFPALQYTLFTAAIVCGVGFWFGKRFAGDVDTRNFTRSEKGPMERRDGWTRPNVKPFLKASRSNSPKGTILGVESRSLVVLPMMPFNKHIGLFRRIRHTQEPGICPPLFTSSV